MTVLAAIQIRLYVYIYFSKLSPSLCIRVRIRLISFAFVLASCFSSGYSFLFLCLHGVIPPVFSSLTLFVRIRLFSSTPVLAPCYAFRIFFFSFTSVFWPCCFSCFLLQFRVLAVLLSRLFCSEARLISQCSVVDGSKFGSSIPDLEIVN